MTLSFPQDDRRHAVVIGGSMAGLVTARILLPYFERVTTEGGRPGARTRLLHRYIDQVLQIASHDAFAQRAFMQVSHLMQPPARLFTPAIIGRVLGHVARNGWRPVETAQSLRPT